jgi:hypothetical protein
VDILGILVCLKERKRIYRKSLQESSSGRTSDLEIKCEKDQFAKWKIDSNGVCVSFTNIDYREFVADEISLGMDLNGDTKIGLQFLGKVVSLGQVMFGITGIGFGFKSNINSSIAMIASTKGFVSLANPGLGWNPVGVARLPNSANFVLYWINSNTQQFGKWEIDVIGASLSNLVIYPPIS